MLFGDLQRLSYIVVRFHPLHDADNVNCNNYSIMYNIKKNELRILVISTQFNFMTKNCKTIYRVKLLNTAQFESTELRVNFLTDDSPWTDYSESSTK